VQHAVNETSTDHQRRFLLAIAVNGDPLDAVVSAPRDCFDARRKIRAHLTTKRISSRPATQRSAHYRASLDLHVPAMSATAAAVTRIARMFRA
jgi:hypothetical protein